MIQGFSEDPGRNFEGGFDNLMCMCLLTFPVMINCMCSTSGVNWVSGRALVFIFVWWGVVGCWGFPIYLSCWFGVVLGKTI